VDIVHIRLTILFLGSSAITPETVTFVNIFNG